MDDLCTIEIEGVDGSLWTVHGPGHGAEGVDLGTSPTGLFDAPVRTLWDQTAFGVGAEFRDVRFEPRDLVFTALIQDMPGRSGRGDMPGRTWQQVDSDWRRAWDYRKETLIHVTTESGTRTLRVRLLESPELSAEFDPHKDGFCALLMTVRAGDPFYQSMPVHDSVVANTASGTKYVTVSNPGNMPIHLEWALEPGARFTIPDWDFRGGSRAITLPLTFKSHAVSINTDPLEEQVTSPTLPNAWALMGGVSFVNEVPPYTPPTQVPVSWSGASGSPSVTVRMRRLWSRPWGLE